MSEIGRIELIVGPVIATHRHNGGRRTLRGLIGDNVHAFATGYCHDTIVTTQVDAQNSPRRNGRRQVHRSTEKQKQERRSEASLPHTAKKIARRHHHSKFWEIRSEMKRNNPKVPAKMPQTENQTVFNKKERSFRKKAEISTRCHEKRT